jgi:hypothetical protein
MRKELSALKSSHLPITFPSPHRFLELDTQLKLVVSTVQPEKAPFSEHVSSNMFHVETSFGSIYLLRNAYKLAPRSKSAMFQTFPWLDTWIVFNMFLNVFKCIMTDEDIERFGPIFFRTVSSKMMLFILNWKNGEI